MLKIHKLQSKCKLLLTLGITSICITFGLLALGSLTYTPELSHAESMVTYRSLDDITYMQEMTANICKASQENETKQLIDTRDDKSYWVTKLKDGNCWMTQNLALDLSTSTPLTGADSDVSSNWTTMHNTQQNEISAFPSNSYLNFSYDPGEYTYTTPTEPVNCGGSENNKIEGCPNWELVPGLSRDVSGDERAHFLAGNYYTYYTANVAEGSNPTYSSICPKGWRLPTGRYDTDEFQSIFNGLTATEFTASPYYFTYGGSVSYHSTVPAKLGAVGYRGYYWSSSAGDSSDEAYYMYLSNNISTAHITKRISGFSVRCIANTESETRTLSNLAYMQDMTMDICKNSAENESRQLIDRRDNQAYWITKLKDKNCWMTQNLAIINKTIYTNDSDMYQPTYSSPFSFKIPSSSVSGFNVSDIAQPKAYYDPTYGVYYNWYTATAGSGDSTVIENGANAINSICPKNWHLPPESGVGSYVSLLTSYGTNRPNTLQFGNQIITDYPLNFTYNGWVSSSVLTPGSSGHYWTSTSSGANSAARLSFEMNKIDLLSSAYRYAGYPIRCVALGGEKQNNDNIQITINPTISLEVADEIEVEKSNTNPSTTDLKVKVTSNQPYSVNISSGSPAMKSETSGVTIPSNGGTLTSNVNNWGIMKPNESTYTKVTTSPQLFYQATVPGINNILFKIGISTAPDLPNGEYSTDITVTATQN